MGKLIVNYFCLKMFPTASSSVFRPVSNIDGPLGRGRPPAPYPRSPLRPDHPTPVVPGLSPTPSRLLDPRPLSPQRRLDGQHPVYSFLARMLVRVLEMNADIDKQKSALISRPDFDPYDVFSMITHGEKSISPADFVDTILKMTTLDPTPFSIWMAIERHRRGSPRIEFDEFVRFVYPIQGFGFPRQYQKQILPTFTEETVHLFSRLWWMIFSREDEIQAMKSDLVRLAGDRLYDHVASLDLHRKGYISIEDLEYFLRFMGYPMSAQEIQILGLELGFYQAKKSYQELTELLLPLK
eukprot:TRINITY_DN19493_c0_g1_i1.p1 TRINITY_DN19493_c0_g1~~TRINITY_DN19493_c0_g1_i1.p1  ORF type:complete len:296 (+),score=28.67 TRINITY_DN19493_c0_g1_i1:99-986(+)